MSSTPQPTAYFEVDGTPADRKRERAEREAAHLRDHPTRLYAYEGRGYDVTGVTLNGVDVKHVCVWADPVNGEVGMYPHKIVDGSVRLLDSLELLPIAFDAIKRDYQAVIPPMVDITVRGTVAVTFRE